MAKQIVILTSGTRGDVLPYLALGKALEQRGLGVRIAAHRPFQSLVERHGLTFAPLADNPNDLLIRPGAMPLTLSAGWLNGLRSSLEFWRAARPLYTALLESAWQASQGAAGVIVGLPTTWGQSIADALGVPCAWCLLQPLTPTRAFPTPLQPWSGSLGGAYNRLSHKLVQQILWQPWRSEINAWRSGRLGLSPLPWNGPYHAIHQKQVPQIYGISPSVLPRPADWPAWHQMSGYWTLDQAAGWKPPAGLLRFLQAGAAPIYAGFGSMQQTPALRSMLIEAARRLQGGPDEVRIIAALGPDSEAGEQLPPNLLTIQETPHDWLFAHLSGALHHGGAGTTAASLRAGLPTAITPVGIDQLFWGEQVARLGVGPKPVAQRHLTVDRLVQLFDQLAHNRPLSRSAQALGVQLRTEDGPAQAAGLLMKEMDL